MPINISRAFLGNEIKTEYGTKYSRMDQVKFNKAFNKFEIKRSA